MSVQKIAFIGTSSAGKTTMAYTTLALLKKAGVSCDGVTQQDRRMTFAQKKFDENSLTQWALFGNQIKVESDLCLIDGIEMVVSDRSPLDLYAYYHAFSGGDSALKNAVFDWCNATYTKLFYLRPVPYEHTAMRAPTEEFRDHVNCVLIDLIETYSYQWSSNIEVEPHDKEEAKLWRRALPSRILGMSGKRQILTQKLSEAIRKVFKDPILVGGSYSNGTAGLRSDLDIYVLAGNEVKGLSEIQGIPVEVFTVPDMNTMRFLRDHFGFIEVTK